MWLSSSHNRVKKELIDKSHSLEKSLFFSRCGICEYCYLPLYFFCADISPIHPFSCVQIFYWIKFHTHFQRIAGHLLGFIFLLFSEKSKNMVEPSSPTVLQLPSLPLTLLSAAVSCDQRKLQAVPCLKFLQELKLTNNKLLQASVYSRL